MHVLISGAGVAGPAMAFFLAKTGARVTIFEKAHELLPYGQNIDVNGSALILVKKMLLMDQLRKYNTTEKGSQFISPKGKTFAPFPVREDSTASLTAEFEILRGDLSLIFYEATKHLANVTYTFGTTIKNVVSNDDDTVKVETSNGDVQEYDLLVAADGQWSRVRKQCFPPENITVMDKNMIAVYFTIPRLPDDNDWWNIYVALGSRIVTTRPDPHGTIRAMFTCCPRNEAQKTAWLQAAKSDRQKQNQFLRKEFADAGWQTERLLDAMEQAPDYYFHVIQQIRMKKWSTGRVVCLGDAAYAPTPLTGSGANLAIIGAYVLAGELSKLENGEHPAKALDAYDSAFRPFVEQIQEVPSIFPGIVHPASTSKRWLLLTIISVLSRVVAMPCFANRTRKVDDEDFKLPTYPKFEGESL
jgi:2-polyprenyl-6-methoxyphenol hydroxylase-like FAD-dependent oxidoreductase